ncbi:hypothetical protein D9M72_345910 [compost metagenome]
MRRRSRSTCSSACEKTFQRLRPSALAANIAWSAHTSRASALSASLGQVATPMLADTTTSSPARR